MLGDESQERDESRPVLGRKAGHETGVDVRQRAVGLGQTLAPNVRYLDDVAPSILRIPAPVDEAVGLEIVEQADQLCRIHVNRLAQALLGQGRVAQFDQGGEVARLKPNGLQCSGELPDRPPAEPG